MQIANSCSWWTFRFQAIKLEKVYTQGQSKLIHINFAILSYIFNFYPKQLFLSGKTEKLKIAALAFFTQGKNYKIMTSVRNLTFKNLLKNIKLLPAEKFGNILAFGKFCKRKRLSIMSANSFIKNNV